MALADNRYSRFVQLAKIAFPLVALGLLSTLFLFSRTLDPNQAIPFADIDVEQIAREQRLANPKFSGLTTDGSEISLVASSALPDPKNPRRLTADNVEATIKTKQGMIFDVEANTAEFDGEANSLELLGEVEIVTNTGYKLVSDALNTSIETTSVESPGPVKGTGPEGSIEAESMSMTTNPNGQVIVFKGNVKLIYQPQG